MAIGFVGSTIHSFAAGNASPTLPAGVQEGDLLLAHIVCGFASSGSASWVAPSGWAHVPASVGVNPRIDTTSRHDVYYKFAGAAETDPVWTGANTGQMSLLAYRGVDPVTPFDIDLTQFTGQFSLDPPEITNVSHTAMLVLFAGCNASVSPPGGEAVGHYTPTSSSYYWTERTDDANPTWEWSASFEYQRVTPGVFNSASLSVVHAVLHIGFLISLKTLDGPLGLRGLGTAVSSGSMSTLILSLPTNYQEGDLLLAIISRRSTDSIVVEPRGWSLVPVAEGSAWPQVNPSVDGQLYIYAKIATAEETDPVQWAFLTSHYVTAIVIAIQGVDGSDPFDADAVTAAVSNTTTPDPPSVTTATNGALVATVFSRRGGVTVNQYTPPLGWTEWVDQPGESMSIGMAIRYYDTAGLVDPDPWTLNTSDDSAAATFAINPGAGGGGEPEPPVAVARSQVIWVG